MKTICALTLCLMLGIDASAQSRPDLFRCEGCEAIHDRSHDGLTWEATIAPRDEAGERLILSGRVLMPDGRTPAPNVVVYAYHTNASGLYPPPENPVSDWHRRHGYLRGWAKTNAQGEYRFVTIRPGTYSSRIDPAHIHLTAKEPERREYWIDEVVFTDDPLVDSRYRGRVQNRGGSGIVTPGRDAQGTWQVRWDIILER
ncbi:MAG: intradiol ring-cleavage dioxygenase [Gemmatimonadota bacterium]